jgi:hypothetical protein
MNVDFLNPNDARWRQFLKDTPHDCYHLPEYAEIAAVDENAFPAAFYAEDGSAACLMPLLIRPIPSALKTPADWFDCASPYGYSGVVVSPQRALWKALSRRVPLRRACAQDRVGLRSVAPAVPSAS